MTPSGSSSLAALHLLDRFERWVDPLDDEDEARAHDLASFLERALPEPRGAELEAAGAFPEAELRAFAREGHAAVLVPRAQGGALEWARAMRSCARFAAYDLDVTLCLGGTVLAAIPLLVAGDEGQRTQYFSAVLRGEMGGLGLSEWAHGSDLAASAVRAAPRDASDAPCADRDASTFVLDGEKRPINNGSRGANVVVLARTSDGDDAFAHTLFLIGRDVEGLLPVPRMDPIGYRCMELSGIRLEGARLPRSAVLGAPGEGFAHARRTLEISRGGVAQMAVGPQAKALALALAHASERKLYGAPIGALGGVRLLVGAMAGRLALSAALARKAARATSHWAGSARALTCAAKLFCPEATDQSVHDASTILGARSLFEHLPMARLRRSAPLLAIFDGSSQLQRDELSRHVERWAERAGEEQGVRDAVAAMREACSGPFDAHRTDEEARALLSPPSTLGAASGARAYLAPLAASAEALPAVARAHRRSGQEVRFPLAECAAWLEAVAALAEADRAADSASAAATEPLLRLGAAEASCVLAPRLAALGLADHAAALLPLAGEVGALRLAAAALVLSSP